MDLQSHRGQNDSKRQLYLLDALALAYRSHFIFINRPLINSKGINTSASYGFTNALIRLIEQHGIDHMVVVFDAIGEGGTFRDEMYDEYKANRSPIPEDLVSNLPYIKAIVEAMDIPVVEIVGVEADDVIGTLARRAEEEKEEVVIVSPDKDFQQLLSSHISMYRPAYRGEEFDPITIDSFREKFGLEPLQFIEVLALMGDSSDNVPGVHGIGEKTAIKLVQQYGTVENLLEHVDEVKGKRAREGLQLHRQDAILSKKLVTIKTDVDVDFDWHTFKRAHPDMPALVSLFSELEFNTLYQKAKTETIFTREITPVPVAAGQTLSMDFGPEHMFAEYDAEKADYTIIRTRARLEEMIDVLGEKTRFAFDTETTSVDPMWASLVGMSFSWKKGQGWYIPTPIPDGTSTEEVVGLLKPLLQGKYTIVGQNIKYDAVVMARHGLKIHGELFDTMVAHYLLAPEGQHNLDVLARTFLNYRPIPISDLIGTGKQQRSMRDVAIEQVGPYACEDADITLQLAVVLHNELEKNGLIEMARRLEFPLIHVLTDMELAGVRIDTVILEEITAQLDRQLHQYELDIYDAAGEEFLIGSTQQLGYILFDKLGLPVVTKTSTGRPSTKENVLETLSIQHPLPGLILDWRRLAKLKSTYTDSLGRLIHPETGRVHTSFNQTVAATGRLSSSNPNLQNIPIRTEMGREVRKAFVPAEGMLMLAADYVQIELRILASMSGDEALKEAFLTGKDIHTATAARVYKIEPEEVTRDQRRKAKEVNYGIPYGVSGWGLAQRLRCSVSEAQELIDQYKKSYSDVSKYIAHVIQKAQTYGYVETLLGRRRYVPNINSRNRTQRSFAERVAVNMPIQGSQADMIKIAMIRIFERLEKERMKTRMILQVHDELVFEVPETELNYIRELVEEEMIEALPLDVPVEVEINVGDNWLDAH